MPYSPFVRSSRRGKLSVMAKLYLLIETENSTHCLVPKSAE